MNSLREHSPGLWTQNLPALRQLSDYKLIAFDMDSTLINIECIDEMAGVVGRQQEVSAITEAAMRGEIADYKDSLRQRVALLKGAPAGVMQQVFEQKLQLNPGVKQLIAACQQAGLSTLIVSGGFDYFTDKLQALLGIDDTRSNKLEIIDDFDPSCPCTAPIGAIPLYLCIGWVHCSWVKYLFNCSFCAVFYF